MTDFRETDAKGRVTLPRGYANATLLIEVVSDVELRIRKAKVVPLMPDEKPIFVEEQQLILSDSDRDVFLAALECPLAPNPALRKLMAGKQPPI